MRRAVLHLPVLLLFIACLPLLSAGGKRGVPSGHSPQVARAAYSRLPLSFEEVPSPGGGPAAYAARGAGYALWLTPEENVIVLRSGAPPSGASHAAEPTAPHKNAVLRTHLIGANTHPRMRGCDPLPGKTNYFIGKDPAKWRRDCATYSRVRYEGVYPGVDLVYYGTQGELEYDFVVRPGVDPGTIRFATDGGARPVLDANGDLLLRAGSETVRQHKPVVYQEVEGTRRELSGTYRIASNGEVGFSVGLYDRTRPLIIDPVITYSAALGGSNGDDPRTTAVAVDQNGYAYLFGVTDSDDFPFTTPGIGSPPTSGRGDAFVAKIDPRASGPNSLIYTTYVGGSGNEAVWPFVSGGVAVDSAGCAYITGETVSPDFPTTPGAFDRTFNSADTLHYDAFVAKLGSSGSSLDYSTFLGGRDSDWGVDIKVDATGSAYVTGYTSSDDFPTTPGAYDTTLNDRDGFVAKLNPAGSGLVYSTYYGGRLGDDWPSALTVDPGSGNVYITGYTNSNDLPVTPGARETAITHGDCSFIAEFNSTGSTLLSSSYFGAEGRAWTKAIAVDPTGGVWVVGNTAAGFVTTSGAFQSNTADNSDAFVAKLSPDLGTLLYASALGGHNTETANAIAIDNLGNGYVAGDIKISGPNPPNDFPLTAGVVKSVMGLGSGFLSVVNPHVSGSGSLVYSTYTGGSGWDAANGVAVDLDGNLYLAGEISSRDFPIVNGHPVPSPTPQGAGLPADFLMVLSGIAPVVRPAAPTRLTVGAVTSTTVDLSWTDNSSNETEFVLERKDGGSFAELARLPANTKSYTDSHLLPATGYTYRLRAVNGTVTSAYSNEVTAQTTTPPQPPPAAPQNLTASAESATVVNLAWRDASNNEDTFEIWRALGSGTQALVAVVGANVQSYRDTGLSEATTYTYTVRAENSGGPSASSNAATVTTPAIPVGTPFNLTASAGTPTEVRLTWSDGSDNEIRFEIQRALGTNAYVPLATVGANVTSYSDITITPGLTYSYRVRAASAATVSSYAVSGPVTVPSVNLLPPSNLRLTVLSATSVHLTWTDNSNGEDSFLIDRATGGNPFVLYKIVGANISDYTDTNLAPNTTFRYQVHASFGNHESDPSNSVSITTPPPAPVPPTNLNAAVAGAGEIDLTWTDASPNEDGFRIQRSTDGTTFSPLGTRGAGETTYQDTGLTVGSTYYYRVRAFNAGGDSAPSNTAQATVLPASPDAPSGLQVTGRTQTALTLAWTAGAGATGYEVERRNGTDFVRVGTPTGTAFTDTGLQPNTSYAYRLRAVNAGGFSGYAGPVTGTTLPNPPAAPASMHVSPLSSTSLKVEWTAPAGPVSGYRLERATSGSFTPLASPGAGDTSYTDLGLQPNTTYQYRLLASNAGGDSPFAGPVSGTTPPPAPAAPQNLRVLGMTSYTIQLGWNSSPNAASYVLERMSGSAEFSVLRTLDSSVTTCTDQSVVAGVTYAYRIKATNTGGESDYSSTVTATIPAGGKLKLSAQSFNFGKVVRGRNTRKTLKLTNIGKGTLVVTVGTVAAPFSVVSGGGTVTLAPKKSVSVLLQFAPTAAQASVASLNVTSTDPAAASVNIALTGTGR